MYPAAHLEFLTQRPNSPDSAPTSSNSSSSASSSTSTSRSSSPRSQPSSSSNGSASSNRFSSSRLDANLSALLGCACGSLSRDRPSKFPRSASSKNDNEAFSKGHGVLEMGICKRCETGFNESVDSLFNGIQVKSVLEQRREVASVFGDLLHLGQFVSFTGNKVDERQFLQFLELLIDKLNNRNVTLQNCLLTELFPNHGIVQLLRLFKSDVQVVAFDCQLKSGLWILNELQSNFRVPLFLQVANDILTNKVGCLDDSKNLVEVLVDQSLLESVLSWVNWHDFNFTLSVQTVTLSTRHLNDIKGVLQGLDCSVVAVQKGILDVVQSGVDQNTGIVPCSALHSDGLVHRHQCFEFLVCNDNGMLRQESDILGVCRPNSIFGVAYLNLCQLFLLLNVVMNHLIRFHQQDGTRSCIEDILNSGIQVNDLGNSISEVSNF
ncbi:hypothetical protein OGAPHI_002254 [Ogataea philodendri]|uniref:Uncharacterized protein n=1 Tax=Ogataea philodendri TaxID=1378263 RepID=A0A9P8PBG5_9ASCO|nr:uncharacterized protein OGAPHI_002254 [Ogataea philodendri]KAH3668500.1 hypothetical protein OGAPHI_002254 [Ogataea philodendri]